MDITLIQSVMQIQALLIFLKVFRRCQVLMLTMVMEISIMMLQQIQVQMRYLQIQAEVLPEQMKFDLQLKYYAIAQIYLSPYKIYLTDLKEKLFTRIFLAAKKYCPITIDDENRLEDFMNYFIVCFRNELEKKNG